MNAIENRVIELTYRNGLTHLSSCLNCVNLIDQIYDLRKPNEPFIMGNGHASLAHYVVLEKYGFCDAQEMVEKHGVHSTRDMEHGIWCSNGSLGQVETVAVGFALADPKRTVWLVTSDGACMEGSVYESFRLASDLKNIRVYVVWNGLGAYGKISRHWTKPDWVQFHAVDQTNYPKWLRGLPGHYLKLTETQYKELIETDA